MLDKYQGCMVGAALGSALGMSADQMPVRPIAPLAFGNIYGNHPNHALLPGQYSGDGVLLLISSRNLVQGTFNCEEYGKELLRAYKIKKLRNPDGAIYASCKRMESTNDFVNSAVFSDTTGSMPLSIPFALRYTDRREMAKELIPAISVTHTHQAAIAATIGFSLLLNTLIETNEPSIAFSSLDSAATNMNPDLLVHLQKAYRLAQTDISLADAAVSIGTTSLVNQSLPMAIFLCSRYQTPEELLAAAVSVGGNAGTIGMLCGAYAGALFGYSALPQKLLEKLERCAIFRDLASKLYSMSQSQTEKE